MESSSVLDNNYICSMIFAVLPCANLGSSIFFSNFCLLGECFQITFTRFTPPHLVIRGHYAAHLTTGAKELHNESNYKHDLVSSCSQA